MFQLMAAGGGGAEDSKLLDELLVQIVGSSRRMLYLPIAMDGVKPSYDQCYDWISSIFGPYGFSITMWTDLSNRSLSDIEDFAAIYIGGGNTFRLLQKIRKERFDGALSAFAQKGGIVYGGSAGAIILGCNIMTCAHMDHNTVGVRDFSGLDLFKGHAIWCHYQDGDDPLIQEYIDKSHSSVIAIPEKSGVFLNGDRIQVVGFEPSFLFQDRGQSKDAIAPGGHI